MLHDGHSCARDAVRVEDSCVLEVPVSAGERRGADGRDGEWRGTRGDWVTARDIFAGK